MIPGSAKIVVVPRITDDGECSGVFVFLEKLVGLNQIVISDIFHEDILLHLEDEEQIKKAMNLCPAAT